MATLGALAIEDGTTAVCPSLGAVRKGSAAYDLVSLEPRWEDAVQEFHEAVQTRGAKHGPQVRAALARLYTAGRPGRIRLSAKGLRTIRMAEPVSEEPSEQRIPASTTLYGRLVGLAEAGNGRLSIRAALDDSGRVDIECDETAIQKAMPLFGKRVRLDVIGTWGGKEMSGWRLESIGPWQELDLLGALLEVRDELAQEGVNIDPDKWIREQD